MYHYSKFTNKKSNACGSEITLKSHIANKYQSWVLKPSFFHYTKLPLDKQKKVELGDGGGDNFFFPTTKRCTVRLAQEEQET